MIQCDPETLTWPKKASNERINQGQTSRSNYLLWECKSPPFSPVLLTAFISLETLKFQDWWIATRRRVTCQRVWVKTRRTEESESTTLKVLSIACDECASVAAIWKSSDKSQRGKVPPEAKPRTAWPMTSMSFVNSCRYCRQQQHHIPVLPVNSTITNHLGLWWGANTTDFKLNCERNFWQNS
jgi:hypothetical protein